jgi:hypothetical protein
MLLGHRKLRDHGNDKTPLLKENFGLDCELPFGGADRLCRNDEQFAADLSDQLMEAKE